MKIKQDIGAQIKIYLSRLNHDVTGAEILFLIYACVFEERLWGRSPQHVVILKNS